jgi:membrane protease YdiL (CAAX protease family)
MNALNPPIKCLSAAARALPESGTVAGTRRKLAFWGALLVVIHIIVGLSLQHPATLKPFVPEVWWDILAAKSLELIILALLIPILLVRDGLSLADIGFAPTQWKADVRRGVVGGAAIWLLHDSLVSLAATGTGGLNINTGMLSVGAPLSADPIELCGLVFSIVVVGPLLEEIIYRGCLMSSARANLGMGPLRTVMVVASSGLIFAMLHTLGHPLYYAVYFVTGLAFALFYRRTGSLAAAVVAHGTVNALCSAKIGMQIWLSLY